MAKHVRFDLESDESDVGEEVNLTADQSEEGPLIRAEQPQDLEIWRNKLGYWVLGLTNNFAYVVMLSAAHDILKHKNHSQNFTMQDAELRFGNTTDERDCNVLSTGTILIADILPALFIKILAPFLYLNINIRVLTVVCLCSLSFISVGLSSQVTLAFFGVICASLSSGLGEATFLAYSTHFHRSSISYWSSGTGGAGIFGSLAYAALIQIGFSPQSTLLAMLVVPLAMSFSFWGLLVHPESTNGTRIQERNIVEPFDCWTKVYHIRFLLKYMMPLFFVYMGEYIINQGLYELIYFRNSSLSHSAQYRWYSVLYSIGVFISRSSLSIVQIRNIGCLAMFQWINVFIFLAGAINSSLGSIPIAFILILWEGLIGGAAYVNTFHRITTEVDPSWKDFSMQICTMSDSAGVTTAGFLSLPLHNAICNMPLPN